MFIASYDSYKEYPVVEDFAWWCPACKGAITGASEEVTLEFARQHIFDHEKHAAMKLAASIGLALPDNSTTTAASLDDILRKRSKPEFTENDRKFLSELKIVW